MERSLSNALTDFLTVAGVWFAAVQVWYGRKAQRDSLSEFRAEKAVEMARAACDRFVAKVTVEDANRDIEAGWPSSSSILCAHQFNWMDLGIYQNPPSSNPIRIPTPYQVSPELQISTIPI
jgi:hypothetical protein